MVSIGSICHLILVLAAVVWDRSAAQLACTPALLSLAPCFNFIAGNASTPTSTCCVQLTGVVQASPRCLCSIFNSTVPALGIPFNQTLVLALPGACNVTAPPLNQCNAVANAPSPVSAEAPEASVAASPVSSPAPESSNHTPAAAATPPSSTSPSGAGATGGSKSVPSTNGSTSKGSTVNTPLRFVLLVLFVASCTSTLRGF